MIADFLLNSIRLFRTSGCLISFPLKMWPIRMHPVDFDQGAAMKEWFKAVTDPLLSSWNAVPATALESLWGIPIGRRFKVLISGLRTFGLLTQHF